MRLHGPTRLNAQREDDQRARIISVPLPRAWQDPLLEACADLASSELTAAGWGENPDEDDKDPHDEPEKIDKKLRLQSHLSQFKRKPSKVQVNVRRASRLV